MLALYIACMYNVHICIHSCMYICMCVYNVWLFVHLRVQECIELQIWAGWVKSEGSRVIVSGPHDIASRSMEENSRHPTTLIFSFRLCLCLSLFRYACVTASMYTYVSLSHSLIPPTLCVCMSVPVVFLWPASSVINDGKVLLHSNTISLYCRHISPTSNFLICVFVLFGKHSVSPMIKSYPNKSNQM